MPFREPIYCPVAERPPQAPYLVNMGLDFEAFARLFDEPVNISSAIRRPEETISLEPALLSKDLLVDGDSSGLPAQHKGVAGEFRADGPTS